MEEGSDLILNELLVIPHVPEPILAAFQTQEKLFEDIIIENSCSSQYDHFSVGAAIMTDFVQTAHTRYNYHGIDGEWHRNVLKKIEVMVGLHDVLGDEKCSQYNFYHLFTRIGIINVHVNENQFYMDQLRLRALHIIWYGWRHYDDNSLIPLVVPFRFCQTSRCCPTTFVNFIPLGLIDDDVCVTSWNPQGQVETSDEVPNIPPINNEMVIGEAPRYDEIPFKVSVEDELARWPVIIACRKNKPPATLINEYGMKAKLSFVAGYDTSGPPHAPTIVCTVMCAGLQYASTSTSKKSAASGAYGAWVDKLVQLGLLTARCHCCNRR